jgi:hypothetical protein
MTVPVPVAAYSEPLTDAPAVATVAHACFEGDLRPHMNAPFGCLLGGKGFICATDGHRVAAVRSEHWRTYQRDNQPRLDAVLARDWKEIGEMGNAAEEASGFPNGWHKLVTLHPAGVGTLTAYIEKGPKKNRRKVTFLNEARVDWLSHHLRLGETAIGFHLPYLVDAWDVCAATTVFVHAEHAINKAKQLVVSPERPLVFTPTARHPFESERFACVMPFRT